jgi:hypothetical protein
VRCRKTPFPIFSQTSLSSRLSLPPLNLGLTLRARGVGKERGRVTVARRQGAAVREVGKPTLVRITEVRQQVACREGVAAREASKLVVVRRQGETARVQSRQAYACGKHERATAGHGRAQGRGDST